MAFENPVPAQPGNELSEAIQKLIGSVDYHYKRSLSGELAEMANSGLTGVLSQLEAEGALDLVRGVDFDEAGMFLEVKFKLDPKGGFTTQDGIAISKPTRESIFITLGKQES